jgi:hypothetical protein
MALSINAIHKPLNDFFLSQFTTDSDSAAVPFASGPCLDEDFVDPRNGAWLLTGAGP